MSVIIITGAATELGRAVARELAEDGHDLLLSDPDLHGGRTLAEELDALAGSASFVHVDLAATTSADALLKAGMVHHGRVDAAINAVWSAPAPGRLHELDREFFDATLGVTISELHLAMRAELAHFLDQGGGVVVNAACAEAVTADDFDGITEMTAYLVATLSSRAALEYAHDNIRVRSYATPRGEGDGTAARVARLVCDEIAATTAPKRPHPAPLAP